MNVTVKGWIRRVRRHGQGMKVVIGRRHFYLRGTDLRHKSGDIVYLLDAMMGNPQLFEPFKAMPNRHC